MNNLKILAKAILGKFWCKVWVSSLGSTLSGNRIKLIRLMKTEQLQHYQLLLNQRCLSRCLKLKRTARALELYPLGYFRKELIITNTRQQMYIHKIIPKSFTSQNQNFQNQFSSTNQLCQRLHYPLSSPSKVKKGLISN